MEIFASGVSAHLICAKKISTVTSSKVEKKLIFWGIKDDQVLTSYKNIWPGNDFR
jgi:hypothetical protein